MRVCLGLVCLVGVLGFSGVFANDEIVEVTATLIPVDQAEVKDLSQIELKKELLLARNRGAEKLMQLSTVVESGKWATIRQGREFWYPEEYSSAKVYKSDGDKKTYSVPVAGSSFSNATVVLPTSPTKMKRIDLGAYLKVRPTVKEDGYIYIEGELKDVVFEGLTQEALPITAKTGQLIKGKQEHEILVSRVDKPLFHRFNKEFGVQLPYASGDDESASQFRKAQKQYDYLIPVQLGDNVFGARGKIDLGNVKPDKQGIIKASMLKASSRAEIIRDVLVRRRPDSLPPRRSAILLLEVKKIPAPTVASEVKVVPGKYRIETKFVESSQPLSISKPVMTLPEFQLLQKNITSKKGVDLLTAPSIQLGPNQASSIKVAKSFVFSTHYETPKAIAAIDSKYAKPIAFETRNTGMALGMTVNHRNHGQIGLKVDCNVTQFEGMLNYGNPIMKIKSGVVKKLKPTVQSENIAEVPVFPFRSCETEVVIPNNSVVAVTIINDRFNDNHIKSRLLKIGQPKSEEVTVARYLTVFIHAKVE